MHPLVRDLYKRFIHVGKDYPQGLTFVRAKAKEGFFLNAALTEDADILLAVNQGRWWVKEMIGVVQFKKYRAMRQRYGDGGAGVSAEALERAAAEALAKGATLGASPAARQS